MAFGVWVFCFIVLLFVMWLHRRHVVCRYLHLTINMVWEACNRCCRTVCTRTWCWRSWLTVTDWKSHGLVAGDDNRQYWQLKSPAAPADWPQTWFAWCCGSPRTIGSQQRPQGCHWWNACTSVHLQLSSWGPLLSHDTVYSHKNRQRLRLGSWALLSIVMRKSLRGKLLGDRLVWTYVSHCF